MPYQPHFVKPYWETIIEAICCCIPCARRSSATNEYERLLQDEEDEIDTEVQHTAPMLRWIALLLSGRYLPDNLQLYAALYRCSGLLQGLRSAKQPTLVEASEPSPMLGQSTSDLIEVLASLCQDLARWLASEDAVIERSDKDQKIDSKELRIPNGNSTHQLQRIIFHAHRLLVQETAPVTVDVELASLVPEIATVRNTAEQALEDLRLAVYSVVQMVLVAVTSEQLTNAVRDVLNSTRDSVADVALSAAHESTAIEETLRPSETERHGTLAEELGGIESAARVVVSSAANVNLAALATSAQSLPQEGLMWAKQQTISGHVLGQKIADTAGQLMDGDKSFREAVQHLAQLSSKYHQAIKTAAASKLPEEIIVADVPDEADDTPSATLNSDLVELSKAVQELLEGLAGGKSLEPVVSELFTLWREIRDDVMSAISAWAEKVQEQLLPMGKDPQASDQREAPESFSKSLRELYDTLSAIIENRPDLRDRFDRIQSMISGFLGEIRREPRLNTICRRLGTLSQICGEVFDQQGRKLTTYGKVLLTDTYSQLFPLLLSLLGNIPLPRVEFTSPQLDAALDDMQIAAVRLIPARLRFEATEAFEWNRIAPNEGQVSVQNIRVQATGLQLAVRQVSFFVREKVTQVSSKWLNYLCCALPSKEDEVTIAGREQERHLGAYREEALLDFGLFGHADNLQGADISLDLAYAGEESVDRFLKVNSCTVSLSDSFALRLKQSHHYVINTLVVQPLVTPIVRLVLERVGSTLLEQGVRGVDERLYAIHRRAMSLASFTRQASRPAIQDYIRVLMDSNAGKSDGQLRAEKLQKEDEERQAREDRIEAQSDERNTAVDVPSRPTVEVKPTAVIINATDEISFSIGAYPTLLPTSAQGPRTGRTQVRNAVVEDEWRDVARERAADTWNEIAQTGGAALQSAGEARKTLKTTKEGLKDARELAGRLEHVGNERQEIESARIADEAGEVEEDATHHWRHDGFDL